MYRENMHLLQSDVFENINTIGEIFFRECLMKPVEIRHEIFMRTRRMMQVGLHTEKVCETMIYLILYLYSVGWVVGRLPNLPFRGRQPEGNSVLVNHISQRHLADSQYKSQEGTVYRMFKRYSIKKVKTMKVPDAGIVDILTQIVNIFLVL